MDKNQEILKAYIEERLSDSDRRLFENDLINDLDLAADVQLFRDLKTIAQHKDLFDLQQKLRDVVNNTPIEPDLTNDLDRGFDRDLEHNLDTDSSEKTGNTEGVLSTKNKSKITRRTWFTVAGLLGMIAFVTLFLLPYREAQHIKNIAQNIDFQAFENIIQFDSTDTRPLARALSAYNQRDYATAETLLTTHLKTQATDTDAAFYLGMCQALTGRFEAARTAFEQTATAPENPLTKPARWYLALCYLHIGDAKKARPLLENLKTDVSFGEKARATLKAIE